MTSDDIAITTVIPEGVNSGGAFFRYGGCEEPISSDSNESCDEPEIQVQNNVVNVSSGLVGCERLEDIRGVPAIALGGGLPWSPAIPP